MKRIILIGLTVIVIFGGCGHGKKISKNENCKEQNTGDYCFQNKTKSDLRIEIGTSSPKTRQTGYNEPKIIILKQGQTQCFYDIPAGPLSYFIETPASFSNDTNPNYYKAQGNLYLDRCKKKTFIIK
jgi:hypothetical protein